jgi:hypothetical protein
MLKLNELIASSKPPVLSEVDPVERGKRPSIAGVGVSMTISDAYLTKTGDAESMPIGDAETMTVGGEPAMVGDVESTMVGGEPVMVGDAGMTIVGESAMVGDAGGSVMTDEGAGESIDPDPIVPTVWR